MTHCPRCGDSRLTIDLVISTTVDVDFNGDTYYTDGPAGADTAWRDQSPTTCRKCGYNGEFAAFEAGSEPDGNLRPTPAARYVAVIEYPADTTNLADQAAITAALLAACPGATISVRAEPGATGDTVSSAQRLHALFKEKGLPEDFLDDLVHDHASPAVASQANNDGPLGQLTFLLESGLGEDSLREILST